MTPFPPINLDALKPGTKSDRNLPCAGAAPFDPRGTRDIGRGWPYDKTPAPTGAALTVDNVNHPSHYTNGKVECIDAIEAALTPEEFRGYCKGNALKYVWRERSKGGDESLQKAAWYLARMVKS